MATLRRPRLAALLSLLAFPGLGQLYNGRARKALLFGLGTPLVAVLFWILPTMPGGVTRMVVAMPILLALSVWSAVDAARDARRLRDQPRPWYSRGDLAVALWAIEGCVIGPVVYLLVVQSVQTFYIPTRAMQETILRGDYVLVDKTVYGIRMPGSKSRLGKRREPGRGEIIVFPYPPDPERPFLMRVIGLAGEEIEIRGTIVLVDGRPLEEPYASHLGPEDEAGRGWGPERVPPGHLFVLGDNRDNSKDSRYWGYVPMDTVIGKVTSIYYSWDAERRRPRWDRIGQRLR